jgi:hypothetical protein
VSAQELSLAWRQLDILQWSVSVFSTAFELRGADLPFFSCAEKKLFEKNVFGEIFYFIFLNVLLLKFDGL